MKNYLVTIRLANGKKEIYSCEALSVFDAKQKAGWAYVREAVVVAVDEA